VAIEGEARGAGGKGRRGLVAGVLGLRLALSVGLVGDGRHDETPSNLMKIYNFWLTSFGESGTDF
jgi:hypothetical protein